ncbi:MAG: type II toxin-antitoxin system RelE/ParE family toxin [bacterium]|nr:type II toxin-antitoxin system RelE/ParE family toxin [bacterium]
MSDQRNEIVYDKDFLKDVRKLPEESQSKLAELIEILEEDVFDSRLHTKPLSAPLQGMFSFRITRDYRVGFKFLSTHTIKLLAVDNRDKIYKRLRRRA